MGLSELVQNEVVQKAEETRKEKAETEKKKPRRGRKRKNKTFYFTQETENAIVLYNKLSWSESTCLDEISLLEAEIEDLKLVDLPDSDKELKMESLTHKLSRMNDNLEYTRFLKETYRESEIEYWKNKIFADYIQMPIEKIVENMYNKYKFIYFDAPAEHIQAEAVHNVLLNLHKYDESKGTKAFSYFTVVAKHHLMQTNNSNHRRYKRAILISQMPPGWDVEDNFDHRQHKIDMSEFIDVMLEFWENNLRTVFTKTRDIQIADAVLELFRRSDSVENFNKKHLYVLIREMTNHKTQYITRVVNMMKDVQEKMLEEFRTTGDIISTVSEYEDEFRW